MSDEVAQAEAAAKRGDAETTVRALLAAWRAMPAAETAAALERLSEAALGDGPFDWQAAAESENVLAVGRLVAQLSDGNAASSAARVAALGWIKDDPRAAAAALRIIAEPPWHATGAKPFWTRLFALLDENADPRSDETLRKAPDRYQTLVNGLTMREWFTGKAEKALEKLRGRYKTVPLIPAALKARLDAIQLSVAPKTVAKKGASESDLFDAVYANPDDDGPRAVLADFLNERKNPRGELITLQLARKNGDNPGREGALLAKNQPAWLGALAPVVRYKNAVEVGPREASWDMHIGVRWNRGFLAGVNFDLNGARVKKLGTLPELATVEFALGLPSDAKLAAPLGTMLGSMRALRGAAGDFGLWQTIGAHTATVNRLEQANVWLRDDEVAPTFAILDTLPKLRFVEVRYTANAEAVLASPVWKRVTELRFGARLYETIVRREKDGTHVTVDTGDGDPRPWTLAILGALPRDEVVSFTVRGYEIRPSFVDLAKPFLRVSSPTIVKW
jgi:uncharacterized protein (TIGR02996 family)